MKSSFLSLSIIIYIFFLILPIFPINNKSAEAIDLIEKIEKFLKGDLSKEFRFPKFQDVKEKLIMATVNGKNIVVTDLKKEMDNILPMRYHRRIAEARRKELLISAVDNLVVDELHYQEAINQGINVKEYVRDKIEKIKKSYADRDNFNNDLKILGVSIERLLELLERKIMVQKIIKKEVNRKISVTEDDLHEYYLAHKEKFIVPEKRRLRMLLIKVSAEKEVQDWKEAGKKIEEIHKELLKGADFASMALKYSEDDYRSKGGDRGFIHKGILMYPLDKIAFSLDVGEISAIIGSLYGYYIIRVEEVIPANLQKYEIINKENLREHIKKLKFEKRLKEWTQMLKIKADIKIIRYQ